MYPELKQQLEILGQEISKRDLQELEIILQSNTDLIINELEDLNSKHQSKLSIKLLISQKFEEVSPQNISIKFRCLKNLKNIIKSEMIELELIDTLDRIEDIIFHLNHKELDETLEVCSGFITNDEIYTLKEMQSKYTDKMNEISELKHVADTIKKMIELNEKKEQMFHLILLKFKENEKILKRLALFLQELDQKEISEEIYAFSDRVIFEKTQKINEEAERRTMIRNFESSISLKAASKLDDVIQHLIVSSEAYIKYIFIQGKPIPIPEYDLSTFRFQEFESNFEFCQESFYLLKIHSLFDFEPCFCLFFSIFLSRLSSYEFFGYCYFEFLEEKKDFFKELYQVLKNKHIILTQTILQKILTLNIPNDAPSFLQFLNRVSSIKCFELDSESYMIFRRLLNEPIIQSTLSFFNTSSVNLSNELDSALRAVYVMDLPEGITGMTLWTLQIVVKRFVSVSFIHSRGAIFFILLHELAHYLQRATCCIVRQSKEQFSPNLMNDRSSTEGGFLLEEKIFGYQVKTLSLKQAEFLLAGGFSNDIEEFRKQFKRLGKLSDDNPSLNLQRGCGILYLGRCGSNFTSGNVIRS